MTVAWLPGKGGWGQGGIVSDLLTSESAIQNRAFRGEGESAVRHLYSLLVSAVLILALISWLNSTIDALTVSSIATKNATASGDDDYVQGLSRYGVTSEIKKMPGHTSAVDQRLRPSRSVGD